MKVKVYYRRNLKMSAGKLAAQVAHAVVGLGVTDKMISIIVLAASDTKFYEARASLEYSYMVTDAGYTELEPGTDTCLAFYESDYDPKN